MKIKLMAGLLFILAFVSITFAQSKNIPDDYILIKNVTIIDMVSDKGQKGYVLLKGDKIDKVSYGKPIKSPDGAVTYDFSGKYLIPGLIDNHVHITHGTYNEAVAQLATALKNGITGVRDMGGDGRMLAQLKRGALIGEIAAPDVYFSAIIAGKHFFDKDPRPTQVALGANVGNEPWQWTVEDDTDFPNIIAQTKGLGATAIKVYARVGKGPLDKVAAETHRQGLMVWAHAAIPPLRPSEIISSGANVVSHAGDFVQYELADEVRDRYSFKSREEQIEYRTRLLDIPFDADTPQIKKLFSMMKENKTVLDSTLWVYKMRPKTKNSLEYAQKVTRLAHESGVLIGAGTDNLNHEMGYVSNIHSEISLLVDAGLSNIDALRAATSVNASGLGESSAIGTIEAGKVANLVVLDKDPLSDINNTRTINTVFKRGKAHEGYASLRMMKMLERR